MLVQWIFYGILLAAAFLFAKIFFLYRGYMKQLPKPPYRPRICQPYLQSWQDTGVTLTWIGHSTLLIKMFDKYILTDPVFTQRIGIRIAGITVGPRRYTEPALHTTEIPAVDVVLLSHAHMDHVDLPSLRQVVSSRTTIITAQHTQKIFRRIRAKKITELAYPRQVVLDDNFRVYAIPAKHWGNRFPWNTKFGWTGYIIEYRDTRLLFAGDTSYIDTFSQIKDRYGEIDIACFPIGAYRPESFQGSHCTPEQAWHMFMESGAHWLVPIHWNTFVLSQEVVSEPIERLLAVAGSDAYRIVIRNQGETFAIAKPK